MCHIDPTLAFIRSQWEAGFTELTSTCTVLIAVVTTTWACAIPQCRRDSCSSLVFFLFTAGLKQYIARTIINQLLPRKTWKPQLTGRFGSHFSHYCSFKTYLFQVADRTSAFVHQCYVITSLWPFQKSQKTNWRCRGVYSCRCMTQTATDRLLFRQIHVWTVAVKNAEAKMLFHLRKSYSPKTSRQKESEIKGKCQGNYIRGRKAPVEAAYYYYYL